MARHKRWYSTKQDLTACRDLNSIAFVLNHWPFFKAMFMLSLKKLQNVT